jgi:hypothetical protein
MLRLASAKLLSHCPTHRRQDRPPGRTEDGFEIAQSMGIALLGLVVAAAFATALEGLGVDVIEGIRQQLNLGGG